MVSFVQLYCCEPVKGRETFEAMMIVYLDKVHPHSSSDPRLLNFSMSALVYRYLLERGSERECMVRPNKEEIRSHDPSNVQIGRNRRFLLYCDVLL